MAGKQQAMSDKEALFWLSDITDFRQLANAGANQVRYAVAFAIAKNALRERIAREENKNQIILCCECQKRYTAEFPILVANSGFYTEDYGHCHYGVRDSEV